MHVVILLSKNENTSAHVRYIFKFFLLFFRKTNSKFSAITLLRAGHVSSLTVTIIVIKIIMHKDGLIKLETIAEMLSTSFFIHPTHFWPSLNVHLHSCHKISGCFH